MRDGFMQDPERFWLSDHPEGGIVRPVVQHEWKQARPVITRYKQDKIYKRGKTKY